MLNVKIIIFEKSSKTDDA